ncbi:MAG: sodium-dependent transporter [Lachnospirales bacterium]
MGRKIIYETFKSKLGLFFATTGCAVGIGNLWVFPYRVGTEGYGMFILIYVLLAFAVGLPLMISEFLIGKNAKNNSVTRMFRKIPTNNEKQAKNFGVIGIMTCVTAIFFAMIYSVVASWSFEYLLKGLTSGYGEFSKGTEYAVVYYNALINDFSRSSIYSITFILIAIGISTFGVSSGIERFSKVFMPLITIILIFLAVYGIVAGDVVQTMNFLKPDISTITSNENGIIRVFVAALGQVFFSLSLGFGAMITYASYMNKNTKVIGISAQIVIFDTVVSLLAVFAMFSVMISQTGTIDTNAGLVFNALIVFFANFSFGRILGVLTFALLLIAALTSILALVETVISAITDGRKSKRKVAVFIVGIIIIVGNIFTQPAFGISISFLAEYGEGIINQLNVIILNVCVPIITLLTAIFVGFRMKKELILQEFKIKGLGNIFYQYIRYGIPLIIFIVFLGGIYDIFVR